MSDLIADATEQMLETKLKTEAWKLEYDTNPALGVLPWLGRLEPARQGASRTSHYELGCSVALGKGF
ncbi:hypothetical protein J4E86_002494 [Alternaria arbusti]|uniref:uncharacterized protein n=1 Tax=Alternaria arbusti TaxID=232088 RepID=UPI00221F7C55|nr:uncharacterized protein J4E86_002494 [Alternaria arbusti]KAI4960868.1 hypothetical protein J4E86_002494 [Alternaria arbusti]